MEIFLIDNDVLVWLQKHFGPRAFEVMRKTNKVHVTRYIANVEFSPNPGKISNEKARDKAIRCREIVRKELVVSEALELERAEDTPNFPGHMARTSEWHKQLGGGGRNRGEATVLALAEMLREKGISVTIVTNDGNARDIAVINGFDVIGGKEFADLLGLK